MSIADIRAIQADALRHAAEIVESLREWGEKDVHIVRNALYSEAAALEKEKNYL